MDPTFAAVLFDMDGTLVRSHYDWPAIRSELGVEGSSLIDGLDALPAGQREQAWARMREIESEASLTASVVDGARELLDLLGRHGVKTALVTNNTGANARDLTERFHLRLDLLLTRDSGLYKPSGAPLIEAMRRLGVDAVRTIAVGDSMYDILSAREAGCGRVIHVNGGDIRVRTAADASFPDLWSLRDHLSRLLGTGADGRWDTPPPDLPAPRG